MRATLLDLGERVALTAVQAFLAVFIVTDTSTVRSGLVAAAAAVLALIKGLVATRLGDRSPSLVR